MSSLPLSLFLLGFVGNFIICDGYSYGYRYGGKEECPRVWEPVCAQGPHGTMTYPNACKAKQDGATILLNRPCKDEEEERRPGGGACPLNYDPVCAKGPSGTKTYPNDCEANLDGAEIISQGECPAIYRRRRYRDFEKCCPVSCECND